MIELQKKGGGASGGTNLFSLQGDWNADTNSPDITGTTQVGYCWRVSVVGSTNLGGITDWRVGDLAVKTVSSWLKIDNEDIAAIWGNIGGDIVNQEDLQDAFDTKSDISHNHSLSGLAEKSYSSLDNLPVIPDELSDLAEDSTHRVVTDIEKGIWNGKQNTFTGIDGKH